jgi:hypothetical protein
MFRVDRNGFKSLCQSEGASGGTDGMQRSEEALHEAEVLADERYKGNAAKGQD